MSQILLILSIASIPLYSFDSGGVQFSHVFMALFCVYIILSTKKLYVQHHEWLLIALSAIVLCRESFAVLQGADFTRSVAEFLYILFPLLVLMGFSRADFYRTYRRPLIIGLGAATIIAIGGVLLLGTSLAIEDGAYTRSTGTFNNPNQLSYFSLSIISIVGILYLRGLITRVHVIILCTTSVYLVLFSLSKAGMAATVVSGMFLILTLNSRRSPTIVSLVCLAGVVTGVIFAYTLGALDDFAFVHRLEGIGADADDSLGARGYWLVFEAGGLAPILGLGQEGVLDILGFEVHSTVFSFLSKYGIVAALLVVSLLYMWSVRVWKELGWVGVAVAVVPPLLYGITHNGSRFSIFWVLVALSFARGPRLVSKARAANKGMALSSR